MELTEELAREITRTALIALIYSTPEWRRNHGLPKGVGTEAIRAVLHCMPTADIQYHKDKEFLAKAVRALRKVK